MKEDRPVLLGHVRCMLYVESVEDLERQYTTAKESAIGQHYPEYLVHLASMYDRREVGPYVTVPPLQLEATIRLTFVKLPCEF